MRELMKPSGPRAVASWQWDYYVAGSRLYYRSGTAPATQPFRMLQLPATAQKVAADRKQVYVWVNEGNDLLAYPVGDSGPVPPAVPLAANDAAAAEALSHPPASVKSAASLRPSANVTLSPQRLLVANYGDSVSAIDVTKNQVVGTLSLTTNAAPVGIAASPNNSQAFTANNSNFNCSACQDFGETIFDPSTMTNTGSLPGHYPATVTVSPDGSTLFVGDDLFTSVIMRVYNTGTLTAGQSIALSASPYQAALSQDGSTLYVVTSDDGYYPTYYQPTDAITSINTTTMTPVYSQFPLGSGCQSLAVQPGTGQIFVACNNILLQTIPVIYAVTIGSDGTITLINTFYTTGTYGLAFSPDGKKLYVTLINSAAVSVLDPVLGTPLDSIAVGTNPISFTVNAGGTRGYVTNSVSNTVSVIDLTSDTVIATVPVGSGPNAAALTFTPPTINASPSALTFTGTAGQSNLSSQNLVMSADQGGSFTAAATTQSGGGWLSLSTASGSFPTTVQVSVNGGSLAVGAYQGTITVTSAGAVNSPFAIPVTLTIASQAAGTVAATVNAASFAANAPVAAGALVSIFGAGIGPAVGVNSSGVPLPTTLANISVTIGGKTAPLLFVSFGQINCQVPFEVAGQSTAAVVVTNSSTLTQTPAVDVLLAGPSNPSSPGIFTVAINGTTQGAILNQDYSFNTPANPAKRGDVVQIFATGQGPVSNAPASGAIALSSPLSTTPVNPVVLIGTLPATVQFSGLAPSFVGLWQVNAYVPAGAASGPVPVQIVLNGSISNTTTVSVQ